MFVTTETQIFLQPDQTSKRKLPQNGKEVKRKERELKVNKITFVFLKIDIQD